jgi:hypothetical protein
MFIADTNLGDVLVTHVIYIFIYIHIINTLRTRS